MKMYIVNEKTRVDSGIYCGFFEWLECQRIVAISDNQKQKIENCRSRGRVLGSDDAGGSWNKNGVIVSICVVWVICEWIGLFLS